MQKHLLPFVAALAFAASSALAESQWRVPVHFAITNDATGGYFYFVVGNHPDLGEWDVLRAVPLAWHDGNVWSADVGIQANTHLEYKFVRRHTGADRIADPDNKDRWYPEGDNLVLDIPAESNAPYATKHVVFRCPWNPPVKIYWSPLSQPVYGTGTNWASLDMTPDPGESGRFTADICEPGEWMQFTFSHMVDGKEDFYRFYGTTNEDFYTPLDAFCVTEGQVFNYEPTHSVSNSRIENVDLVWSEADGVTNRGIRIYLPRGYDNPENASRRYPVLYFADGQNIFSDRHSSTDAWGVDTAADREIRGGRMREAILVGVPCRNDPPPGATSNFTYAGRLWEYLPGSDVLRDPTGQTTFAIQGNGYNYMKFLLGNVVPTLNYNYRTLQDRANTGHVGSSAGGLLSFWMGAYTNAFGLVGAVSGVYHQDYIPNFRQWCREHIGELGTNKLKRIWLDTGTEETNIMGLNLYESNWDALTLLLHAGHVQNKTLHFGIYTGVYGQHNEYAWAARSADILRFLLPVTDEFNPLLPIELSSAGNGAIAYPLYPGAANELVRLDSLLPLHTNSVVPLDASTDKPWDTDTFVPDDAGFYFIRSKPSP